MALRFWPLDYGEAKEALRLVSAAAVVTAEPSPSMRRAISVSLPIVLAVILLPVIAFAVPPDPSWIAGVYDGADGDDIVSLVYETSAANTTVASHLGPHPCLLAMSLEDIGRNVPDRYFTRGPRSPPVLCSLEFTHVFNASHPPSLGSDASVSLPSITNFPCPRLTTSPSVAAQKLVQPTEKITHCISGRPSHVPQHSGRVRPAASDCQAGAGRPLLAAARAARTNDQGANRE